MIDTAGRPLAKARIVIQLPRDFRVAFPHNLDASAERAWVAESDERGHFEFADAPRVEGAKLEVSLEGYAPIAMDAPDVSDRALEIVLRRPDLAPGMLAGLVVDEHGERVAGARVSLGSNALTQTDEHGAFTLQIPKDGDRKRWIAVKPGHQPAMQSASSAVQSGQVDASESVVLRLGPPPLSISGRVVDDENRPRAGFKVFVADPTFFGAADEVPAHVEGLLAGAPARAELEKRMASAPQGTDPEELLKNSSSVFWTFVVTDAQGRFTIVGLLDRMYRVAALDPETLLRVESEPMPAGVQDALIRLPKSPYLVNVRGKVVSSAGKPLAGVTLTPNHDVMTVQIDEHSWSTFDVGSKPVITDAEGRFAFDKLPREKVYLKVTGDDILPIDWGRKEAGGIEAAAHAKLAEIVITATLRYHFRVELAPDLADEMRVVDADGRPVMINVFEGHSSMTTDSLALVGGRSKVMVVGEEARTLVLSKEKKEVRRLPLELVAGEVNVVRM